MRILILGAPGSGKGTYSEGISRSLHIPHISSGDLLRHLRAHHRLSRKIRSYIDKGKPFPDRMMIPLLIKRLSRKDCRKGFIFDTVYTVNQAKTFERIWGIDLVINLLLPDVVIVKKNLGRRTCRNCGTLYNLAKINELGVRMPALPPRREGICDRCGGPLFVRHDDNEKAIRIRLKLYRERAKPLLRFYRRRGIVRDVKVTGLPDKITSKILRIVKAARGYPFIEEKRK